MFIKTIKLSCLVLLLGSQAGFATNTDELLQQGQASFQRADYPQAISSWEQALTEMSLDTSAYLDTLTHLAAAYQATGNYAKAHALLQQAMQMAKEKGGGEQQVLIHSQLGDVLLAMQQLEAANTLLQSGLVKARTLNNPVILAHLLNNLGNVLSVQQNFTDALKVYTEVAELAQRSGNLSLHLQSLLNQAKLYLKQNLPQESLETLKTAWAILQKQPRDYTTGLQLLSVGELALREPQGQQMAYQIFQDVLALANQQKNQRLRASASGFLGKVYEQQQRHEEALRFTRQAIFFAQEYQDILYIWEWQLGRLLLNQQDLTGALAAYQQARDHLYPIQTRLVIGQRNASETFQERIRPIYFGFADVLLQQAAKVDSPTAKQALLQRAREVVEQLKAAELQDYFQDECVSFVQEDKVAQLDLLEPHTAVLYPILLPTRTELLLSTPDGIHQFITKVGAEELGNTVLEFRRNVQNGVHNRFVNQAKQLYEWLIAPLHNQFGDHHINTLVIVPDGPLRTIPMAALYNPDTRKFLVEEVAITVTPGLSLTEPRPLNRQNISILLNGLSEGVQSFQPLPNVPKEVLSIETLFQNRQVLLDKMFLLQTFDQSLQKTPYSIVHLASHGQFDRDPKKTFVLTYDARLTMNRLESLLRFTQLRKEPVELLTLSACETAVGDERAALGLAGVAIKAGARSALASLWSVNDESTTELMTEFYRQLQNPTLSKAQALQHAQQKLIRSSEFRHPMYWAPFLLIGNWL